MEQTMIVREVSPKRTFDGTNRYGQSEQQTVKSIIAETASGLLAADAFGPVAEALEKSHVQPGDVLMGQLYFKTRSWKTQQGEERLETKINLTQFIITHKETD